VLYPNVDKLAINGKKIFVKSPVTIELSKNKAPYTPLPPTPNSSNYTVGNLVGCHFVL
jgi:hypothetical protein